MFHGCSSDNNLQHLYSDFNTVAVALQYNENIKSTTFSIRFCCTHAGAFYSLVYYSGREWRVN
jgi:hypothetical protein